MGRPFHASCDVRSGVTVILQCLIPLVVVAFCGFCNSLPAAFCVIDGVVTKRVCRALCLSVKDGRCVPAQPERPEEEAQMSSHFKKMTRRISARLVLVSAGLIGLHNISWQNRDRAKHGLMTEAVLHAGMISYTAIFSWLLCWKVAEMKCSN